jgi:hypothetical protein
MRLRLVVVTLGLFVVSASLPAYAETIDFTSITLGPENIIRVGGVTVQGDDGAFVSTVAGQGLGLSGVGSDGSVDALVTWTADSTTVQRDGRLTVAVDGVINSITLQAFYTELEGPVVEGVHVFTVGEFPHATGLGSTINLFTVTPEQPFTLTYKSNQLPFSVSDLGIFQNIDADLSNYRNLYPDGAGTILFGFSIVALDYTPTQGVPEPGALALLAPAAFVLLRRRHG